MPALGACHGGHVDDRVQLAARNEEFIVAGRAGSWKRLRPILDGQLGYLDGGTGQVWDVGRDAADPAR